MMAEPGLKISLKNWLVDSPLRWAFYSIFFGYGFNCSGIVIFPPFGCDISQCIVTIYAKKL